MKTANHKPTEKLPFHALAPRIWHGMTFTVWMRLLARNRFAISPSRLPMSASITAASVVNSAFRLVDEALNSRRIAAAQPQPPLFIVGHWRTGTTLLHELMVQDDRFNSPTTLQVMSPHHFLSSSWLTRPLMRLVLPKQRPMDAMALGADLPQEDEFALCNLGFDSTYLQWAWPNNRELERYIDLDASGEEHRQRWMAALHRFLKRLTVLDDRRIVLKSPTHTARLRTLHEMYPDAAFVHIVRNPIDVIPSAVRTFRRLYFMQGLQEPRYEQLEETIFDQFDAMDRLVQRDRDTIPAANLIEVRYEDLVAAPLETVGRIYQHLQLDGFDAVQPKLRQYFETAKDYKPNRHQPSPELLETIRRRCGDYIKRYGYE